jgi:hypothetical protein
MFLLFSARCLWSDPVRLCLYGVRDMRAGVQTAPLRRTECSEQRGNDEFKWPQIVRGGVFGRVNNDSCEYRTRHGSPYDKNHCQERALPNARVVAARSPTTSRPVPYNVFGSAILA